MRALIVVDVQRDFLPGGALAVPNGDEILPQLDRLAQEADVVVATRDWHPIDHCSFAYPAEVEYRDGSWPTHCVADSPGAEFGWRVPFDAVIISKGENAEREAYSGFDGLSTDGFTLQRILEAHDVDEVVVVGLALDYCVKATALDARRLGFRTRVPLEATRAVSDDTGDAAVATMKNAGVGVPTPTPVVDAAGREIRVGQKVYVGLVDVPDATVVRITDPDGDVDDEGRPYGINPRVGVRYDIEEAVDKDGVHEWWETHWTARGPWDEDAPYAADDIRVPE